MLSSFRSALTLAVALATNAWGQAGTNAMNNPYRMVENWGQLAAGNLWGSAIGIIPDGEGGAWVHHRSEPPIMKLDGDGRVVKSFGEGMFVQAHGFCMDQEGNLWAGDSGPFGDDPSKAGRGYQFFKFDQDGKLLLTLGKAGVSKAGRDTFIAPTACAVGPGGDIFIADGHFPRPSTSQQDGDRIVRFTADGRFVGSWGRKGSGPGEFDGPHALAFDSQGRLFVADRSNNRVQILDSEMRFVDDWRHFGRPSGIAISSDDVLYVSDSESGKRIAGARPESGLEERRADRQRPRRLAPRVHRRHRPGGPWSRRGRHRVHRAHARPARRPSPAAEVGEKVACSPGGVEEAHPRRPGGSAGTSRPGRHAH